MTVRDKVGRTRYVAFRVAQGAPVPRPAMAAALPEWARLTRFDGTHGLVRCLHTQRDALLEAMGAIARAGNREVRVETIATSGTLRKAAESLPPDAPARARGKRPDEKRPPRADARADGRRRPSGQEPNVK